MPYDAPDPDNACATCDAIPPESGACEGCKCAGPDRTTTHLLQARDLGQKAAAELERLQAENATLQRTAEALSRLESMARELAARPEPAEISVWYDGEMYWAEASYVYGWAGNACSACELLLGMPEEATDDTHNHPD